MKIKKHPARNFSGGVTLIELLVTLAIFSFVTLVLTTSFITMIGSRGQVLALQQVNDEFRVVLDTMELEVSSGSNFSTGGCDVEGICSRVSFDLRTREDLPNYFVSYRLGDDNRIEKAIQRSDGVCSAGDFADNPACWFPVTSEDVDIAVLNFSVTFDEEQTFQRPVVTISLEAEVTAETGETVPFTRSASYAPRAMIATEEIERSDTASPQITFRYILPQSPSGCSVWSDRSGTPFNNNQNWTFNQTIPAVYTNCSSVRIGFDAQDTGSGLFGGRYDGEMAVEGGSCSESCDFGPLCPCSENPRSAYSMPSGISVSTSFPVPFDYEDVLLRPGVDIESRPQKIYIRARDMAGNITPDESHIPIYTLTEFPLTTDGMLGLARVYCDHPGDARHWLLIAPAPPSNFYQHYVRVHRCYGGSADTTCVPVTQGESSDPTQPRRDFVMKETSSGYVYWHYHDSDEYHRVSLNNSSRSHRYSHNHSSLSRDRYYRYQFTVYDPYSNRVSSPQYIRWEQRFNTELSAQSYWQSVSFSDSGDTDWRFVADGSGGAVGDGRVGKIPPSAEFCTPPPPADDGGTVVDDGGDDDGGGGGGTTASLSVSTSGDFRVSVTGGSGTRQTTAVTVRNNGNVTATVRISSKSLSTANLATSYTIAPGSSKSVRLVVPDNSASGKYNIVLELSGSGASATTGTIPLVVSRSTGGTT